MNLTNILVELFSLSNLAIFVNRFIVDGNYETAILQYDDASIRDTNFIADLSGLSNHNYTIFAKRLDWLNMPPSWEMEPFRKFQNAMQIFMVDCQQEWEHRFNSIVSQLFIYRRNFVFLLPMQHGERKQEIMQTATRYADVENCTMIFYQSPTKVHPSVNGKSIEVSIEENVTLF